MRTAMRVPNRDYGRARTGTYVYPARPHMHVTSRAPGREWVEAAPARAPGVSGSLVRVVDDRDERGI